MDANAVLARVAQAVFDQRDVQAIDRFVTGSGGLPLFGRRFGGIGKLFERGWLDSHVGCHLHDPTFQRSIEFEMGISR